MRIPGREEPYPGKYVEKPAFRLIEMDRFSSANVAHTKASFSKPGNKRRGRRMAPAVPSEKPVVLIVEDEILLRITAEDIVEEAGFRAISASDADEAIRILESRNDIRAVFTDIHMPGSIDGLRLARVVRSRWPPVALIVTSGHRDFASGDLPSGARYLGKPYQAAHVEAALRDLIS
jgi:CheY-like chemotaxis protein